VRVFTDASIGPSPLWLKARLIAAGQRPINNVVDITNYVMLLLGQPMHAYDLDRLAGPMLHVRRAREGERLTTLDGEERCFDDDAVLICDANGPSGIGGIMGGAASEVGPDTVNVALEAATWNGPNILTTSSKLGLRTEASGRFEKQLHPELALAGQRLAARLMVELCGAHAAPATIDVSAELDPRPPITLRSSRMERLLGQRIEPDEATEVLERLGFGVERSGADLEARVPYYRQSDVTREADLIEEVARVRGLDKLPATLPARRGAVGGLTADQRSRRLAEDLLRARGLNEVVTYSFLAEGLLDKLMLPDTDVRLRALRIANPLSEDQSVMRTMLLPGLLQVAARNLARDERELRLFETGRIFVSNGSERQPTERLHLGVLLAGTYLPKTWRSEEVKPDFHVAKALLSALLEALRVEWRLAGGGPAFLHPGRAAEVLVGAQEAGWVGELHPLIARSFGLGELERPPAFFELDLDVIAAATAPPARYEDLSTYPAVLQDIAVVVNEAVEAQTVVETVRAAGGEYLRTVSVFDLYRGKQLGEDEKSLALRLEFQAPDRTLTDDEVAEQREQIRKAVSRELGGRLRE
jgi:phenylalanyl-tRNA synthetase beta chain